MQLPADGIAIVLSIMDRTELCIAGLLGVRATGQSQQPPNRYYAKPKAPFQ
jgi:hypothetical protein